MSVRLDKKQILALIAEVTAEKPDFVSACVYQRDGAPCCIVGAVMHRVGVPVATLEEWDSKSDSSFGEVAKEGFLEVELTHEALKVLDIAQSRQDSGETWECVARTVGAR
jgi:hypothetical protein